MKYKLIPDGVFRSDGACIPNIMECRQWREFLAWVEAGNTPIPLEDPIPEDFLDGHSAVQQL
jgi:hypothetical protein